MIWHSATSQEVLAELNTSITQGLTEKEAAARLRREGKNALRDKKRRTFSQILWEQFKSPVTLILLVAAALWLLTSLLLESNNHWAALTVIGIVLVGVLIDAVKDAVAESSLDSLRNVSQHTAKVLRDGMVTTVVANKLVPGDIMLLEQGDYISADARLITCEQLRCDENMLSGEPVSVEKQLDELLADIVPIDKRTNMVYSGCTVSHGVATAVVVATGMATESAKIAMVVEDSLQIATPLQKQWKTTARSIGTAALAVSILIFVLSMFLAEGDPFERFGSSFMACATLAASAVPGSLAATITTVLAVGVNRMVHRKMQVNVLDAVETLGKVSVICTDKTGTLTQNNMKMTRIFSGKSLIDLQDDTELPTGLKDLLFMGAMCCDAQVDIDNEQEVISGDHTEAGIVAAAVRYGGFDKETIDNMYPRMCDIPFDADRKLKTSVNMIDGKPVAVVKGAPDIIISRCSNCDAKLAAEAARTMADSALRVIGIAYKPLDEVPANPTQEELEYDLVFGGLVGLSDPPIPEAVLSIQQARQAGIQVVMMTGDHVSTAVASARQMGVLTRGNGVMTNEELDALTDEELDGLVDTIGLYVRLSAENKGRVVASFQRKGHVVAITGDRVEDAAVLRQADIGCAMGQTGTDVAKRAAHVVVTDDKFSTILEGIGAGRGIYDNLGKAIRLALGFVLSIGVVMLACLIVTGSLPLNAVQIMCLNLLVSVASVLPFALERPAKGLLSRPPREDDRIYGKRNLALSILHAVLLSMASIGAYMLGREIDLTTASTMVFLTLGFGQFLYAFCARSRYSLLDFKRNHFNYWLVVSLVIAVGVLMAILKVTWLNQLFGLVALAGEQFGVVIGLSVLPFVITEVLKFPLWVSSSVGKK